MVTIGIVGRPNVGKSSLLNTLLKYRRAIVCPEAGTTMDEVQEAVRWRDQALALVDSQGIWSEADGEVLDKLIKRCDALLLVVDAAVGATPFDHWVANRVRTAQVPVLLVVNKSELNPGSIGDFGELGFDEMVEVSATQKSGLTELKEWCAAQAEKAPGTFPTSDLNVAIIGRPNTGKSTLMNRLCRLNVSRVSDQPLTTRDPVRYVVDTPDGKIRFVDTAGIRRPSRKKGTIEVFSVQAATRSIRKADVVFLSIASHERITDQDMRLLSLLEREGKPAAILLNFWDRLDDEERRKFLEMSTFAFYLEKFPVIKLSGLTGRGVAPLPKIAFELSRNSEKRVGTAELNRVVENMVQKNPPPVMGKNRFNILYASQVSVKPPTFVFFMNRKGALPASYQKYVENHLRSEFKFGGQPLRVYFRNKEDRRKSV